VDDDDDARQAAIRRLRAKHAFQQALVAYVVVNAFLVVVWFASGGGYFWPVWVMAGWGMGLVLLGWNTYGRRPITENDIRREMGRGGPDVTDRRPDTGL
jgi:hypothetical protein